MRGTNKLISLSIVGTALLWCGMGEAFVVVTTKNSHHTHHPHHDVNHNKQHHPHQIRQTMHERTSPPFLPMTSSSTEEEESTVTTADAAEKQEEIKEETDTAAKKELTYEQIVELVEVSFIHACMQLSQGYVDVLKCFIVAVKASYEQGTESAQLIDDVTHNCPINTAGRDLVPEELQLRSTWIQAVYLMLDYLDHPLPQEHPKKEPTEETTRPALATQYRDFLPILTKLQNTGTATFTEALKQSENVLDYPSPSSPTAIVDRAMITQTLKVFWFTITVLNEEEDADNSADIPRPPIPGTQ